MDNGWNLWVWLECIDVVSGCCIDILILLIPTPLVSSFFVAASLLLFILKMLFLSCIVLIVRKTNCIP